MEEESLRAREKWRRKRAVAARASWDFGSAAPCFACRWDAVILPYRGTVILAEDGRSLLGLRGECIDIYKYRCEL